MMHTLGNHIVYTLHFSVTAKCQLLKAWCYLLVKEISHFRRRLKVTGVDKKDKNHAVEFYNAIKLINLINFCSTFLLIIVA